MEKNQKTMLRLKSRIKILKENTVSLDAKQIASDILSKYETTEVTESYLSQFEGFLSTEIVRQLKDIKDPEAEKFVVRESRLIAIQNLGVKSSIKKIRESEIYSYPTVKYLIQNLKQVEVSPEFLVAEYFLNKLQPYLWDTTITECYNSLKENIEKYSEDIALNKAILEFENSSSDYLLKAFESELDEYTIHRNTVTRIKLLEKLENYKFDNQVRKLSNIVKEHTATFELKSTGGQNEIENVYSPTMIIENFDVFYTSGRYIKKDGDKVEVVTEDEVNKLPDVFKSICEFLSLPTTSVTENKVTVYSRDKKVELKETDGKIEIFVNENKVDLKNFNKIFVNAGIFHNDEMTTMNKVYQVIEHFNSIANIDYAKRIRSTVLDNHWVDVITVDEKIFTIKFDARNRINEFKELNAIQTREMVLEFMQYDIAESFRDLITKDEAIIKSIEDGKKEILEAIEYLETKKADILIAINESEELKEDSEVKDVVDGISKEIESLKKSYSELSSQIETLTSSEGKKTKNECDAVGDKDKKLNSEDDEEDLEEAKVNEDDLPVGAIVKCKESGKTGTIQSWDDANSVYIVLMDGGNDTLEFQEGELEIIKEIGESGKFIYDLEQPIGAYAKMDKLNDLYFKFLIAYAKSKKIDTSNMSDGDLNNKLSDEVKKEFKLKGSKFAELAQELIKGGFIKESKITESDLTAGTQVKLKDGSTGTVQSWKESEGTYIVLLDGGNDTIEVADGELEIIKEIGEDLSTKLSDNQKNSIDIMTGKELSTDDIISIINSSNTDVDHSAAILAYMKKADGPVKLNVDDKELQEDDSAKKKDPDKVDLEKKEGKETTIENEEKESPINSGDKVKLKNGVIGQVQSVDKTSGEAIVNMEDGNTVSIPEDKFSELEIIKKKSVESDPEIKIKQKSSKDGESTEVQEATADWVNADITKGKLKGKTVKIRALDYTSGSSTDMIEVKINGNSEYVEKRYIKV